MRSTNALSPVLTTACPLHQRPQGIKRAGVSPREIERLVDEARNLVPMFARRHLGRGVLFEDLVGAGNLGVVEAAHRFDPGRGVKFGSYAAWWIRKAISGAVATAASVVAVPRYSFERRRQVIEAQRSGRAEGRHDLGAGDVAAGLGLSSRQVEQALAFSIGAISLDTPVAHDDTRCVADRLARPAEEGPEAIVLESDRVRCARAALAVLSPRQRLVIALRFGLGGDDAEPASLTEVARAMGLSRERVRQIEGQALAAVRSELATVGWKAKRG